MPVRRPQRGSETLERPAVPKTAWHLSQRLEKDCEKGVWYFARGRKEPQQLRDEHRLATQLGRPQHEVEEALLAVKVLTKGGKLTRAAGGTNIEYFKQAVEKAIETHKSPPSDSEGEG